MKFTVHWSSRQLFHRRTSYDRHSRYSASKALLIISYVKPPTGLPVAEFRTVPTTTEPTIFRKLIPLAIHNIKTTNQFRVYGKGATCATGFGYYHARAIDIIFHKGKNGETYIFGRHNELDQHRPDKETLRNHGSQSQVWAGHIGSVNHFCKKTVPATTCVTQWCFELSTWTRLEPSLQFEEGLEQSTGIWQIRNGSERNKWMIRISTLRNTRKIITNRIHIKFPVLQCREISELLISPLPIQMWRSAL